MKISRAHNILCIQAGHDGRSVSGIVLEHHLAHQYSSDYSSARQNTIVISHDGGTAVEDMLQNRVVAICTGRSETGPRALGTRSIIANPQHANSWERVNHIKKRESWRPFAPVMRQEKLGVYFEENCLTSPYHALHLHHA